MHLTKIWFFGVVFAVTGGNAVAVESTMGPAGFTGLSITPSAHIQPWGTFSFSYDNQLPGVVLRPDGHNFVGGFGIFPNFEISGRIATNQFNSNCYVESCGIARDLSGSGKFGIGLDAAGRYRVAVGATDLGGKVSYFTSYYGVATYSSDSIDISLGLAKRRNNGVAVGTGAVGSKSPLNGIFGNVIYQPESWIQGSLEYSDKNAWGGVKLFAPSEWLPSGWKGYVGANVRLNKNNYTEKSWVNAGIIIPLYKVPSLSDAPKSNFSSIEKFTLPAYEARTLSPSEHSASEVSPSAKSRESLEIKERDVADDKLAALSNELKNKGFEDISVGRDGRGGIAVRVNNATYNWNTLDALGVAIGVLSRELGDFKIGYSVILTQRQIAIVAITGQANCLRDWINSAAATCTAGQLFTPGTQPLDNLQSDVNWVVSNLAPSWKTIRIGLSPAVNTAVATEYGTLDYSIGARVSLTQPLWKGAFAEVRQIVPLADSDNYKDGKVYSKSRLNNVTDRVILSQTVRIPVESVLPNVDAAKIAAYGLNAITLQGTLGRINQHYDGGHFDLRWGPGEGQNRFSVEGGYFKNTEFVPILYGPITAAKEPKTSTPLIGTYRYAYGPTRTYFEMSAGQFLYNDRGFQASIIQWFGDVAVSLYYRKTKFELDNTAKQFVGIQLSIPIGPRKDMNPTMGIQVTGNQRFGYGLETLVRANSLNYVTTGHGVLPGGPVLNDMFNSDRSGLMYYEDNMRRIRDAARS